MNTSTVQRCIAGSSPAVSTSSTHVLEIENIFSDLVDTNIKELRCQRNIGGAWEGKFLSVILKNYQAPDNALPIGFCITYKDIERLYETAKKLHDKMNEQVGKLCITA